MHAIIADDDELALEILRHIVEQMGYTVSLARNGREALELLQTSPARLVITDWEMPELDGLEFCRAVRSEDYNGYIYIIMLTAQDSPDSRIEGLHAGADAFLNKPVKPAELLVCLRMAERILALETRDLAMFAMAKLAESRDPETGAHIERVQSYARLLAQYLSGQAQHHEVVDAEFVRLIYQTSPLHDIGKVGIPDQVLLKPGKLTRDEFQVMKTHTELGAQTLEAALQRFPNAKFLQMARDIANSHHERFDGTGYPAGLVGQQIPMCGRIVALADVYDALTSRRVYKEAMSHQQSRQIIVAESGHHFDPDIVEAFLACEKQFIAVGYRLRDSDGLTPDSSAAPAVATLPVAPSADRSTQSVLLVDDDPAQLEILQAMVAQSGYTILTARDGAEALRIVTTQHPRVVISDWSMPNMDGLAMCRQLRTMTALPYVYVVLLTIHAEKQHLVEAFDAGVDDFIAKPIAPIELFARLRAGFRAVTLHDDLVHKNLGASALNAQLSGLNTRLEKLAITDDLTGLYNRRHAMLRLEEHWSVADRYKRPLSIFVVDIDHFKQINDTYGHGAGDVILQQVALTLRQTARTTDTVCRIGGEEFLILCPAETACEALTCAERCRAAIAQHTFAIGNRSVHVTASIGVSAKRLDLLLFSDLLNEADEALYQAKRAGRNRVEICPACAGVAGVRA